MAHPKKRSILMGEAQKCVLLCSNHHKELHAGILVLSVTESNFDAERFMALKGKSFLEGDRFCEECGIRLEDWQESYCSRRCSAINTRNTG